MSAHPRRRPNNELEHQAADVTSRRPSRRAFTLTELLVVVTILACLWVLAVGMDPQRPHRLDDRFGLIPAGLVLLWGAGLAIQEARKDRTRSVLVLGAIVAIVCPLFNRRWGMSVKEWLLASQIDPFYWEALLTFAMSLPILVALGLLFAAAFRPDGATNVAGTASNAPAACHDNTRNDAEPSHVPEPAAGPDSSEESSPPAR